MTNDPRISAQWPQWPQWPDRVMSLVACLLILALMAGAMLGCLAGSY